MDSSLYPSPLGAMCAELDRSKFAALLRGVRLTGFAPKRAGAKRNRRTSFQTLPERANVAGACELSHQKTMRKFRLVHLVMANV